MRRKNITIQQVDNGYLLTISVVDDRVTDNTFGQASVVDQKTLVYANAEELVADLGAFLRNPAEAN